MRRWFAICLIGAAILSRPALAAPMAADQTPRSVPIPPILNQDARLGKKVTLRLRKSPLSTVVAELGRQTGVTLAASAEVADEPAIVYVTEQPAKVVMHHLATLFNFRWKGQGKPGEASYELYQDVKSRQEEEALRQREISQALAGLRQAIRERLALAQRSPEELNKAADAAAAEEAEIDAALNAAGSPSSRPARFASRAAAHRRSTGLDAAASRMRAMADEVQRALIHVAASLSPDQWDALAGGKPLLFSTRPEEGTLPLPPALSRELREARPKWGEPGMRYKHDLPEDEAQFQQMEAEFQNGWARADAIRLSVWLDVPPRPFGMLDWVSRPGEAPSRQATLCLAPAPQMSAGFRSAFMPSFSGMKVASEEAPSLRAEGEKPVRHQPEADAADAADDAAEDHDPILGIKRSFPLELKFVDADYGWSRFQFLNEVMPRIAETYGINLIADAYRQRFPVWPPPSSKEERTLAAVLNQYILPRARWSRDGEFIHVRRWTWYDDRLAEIPERIVKHWSEYLRKQPSLSLADAAALALSLRDSQLESFEGAMREEGVRLRDANLIPESGLFHQSVLKNPEILRAYGSLTLTQRQSLGSGKPAAYTAMSPEARGWLRAAVARQLRLPPDPYSGGLPAWLPPVITGEAPQALTLSRLTLQDGSAPGGSFEQSDLHVEYGEETRRAYFMFIPPRVAVERRTPGNGLVTDPGAH